MRLSLRTAPIAFGLASFAVTFLGSWLVLRQTTEREINHSASWIRMEGIARRFAEESLVRSKAGFLRELNTVSANVVLKQNLFRLRRAVASDPETDDSLLLNSTIESAALYDGRRMLAQYRNPRRMSRLRVLRDSAWVNRSIQQSSWTDFEPREGCLVGGVKIQGLADSAFVLGVVGIDTALAADYRWLERQGRDETAVPPTSFSPMWWAGLLALGVAVLFGAGFHSLSVSVRRRIEQVQFALAQVQTGNFDFRLGSATETSEWVNLQKQFDLMAESLRISQERMVYLEKVSAWKEIAQRMAHEIKNPLTPIRLTIEQIRDAYDGSDSRYRTLLLESVQIIMEEIDNLRQLTMEFSDFARLPQMHFRPFALDDLLREIASMYAKLPIHLECGAPMTIEADREALRRALVNVIENARLAVADKSDGRIIMRSGETTDGAWVEVADNGPGISREDMPRIFEPHFSTRSSGMGLGLAIAKNIIEEHRGQITVESVERRGATFRIQLKSQVRFLTDEEVA